MFSSSLKHFYNSGSLIRRKPSSSPRKMVSCCCVHGCNEYFKKGGPVTFHKFPKDENRRKEWEKMLNQDNFKASNYIMICSKHFEESCFDRTRFGGTWLKPDAKPTIFHFPVHLTRQEKLRKPSKRQTEDSQPSSSFACDLTSKKVKKFSYLKDFTDDDMDSPSIARRALFVAKKERSKRASKLRNLRRKNKSLEKRVADLQEVLWEIKKNYRITDSSCDVLEKLLSVSDQSDAPLEPEVVIKEEPINIDEEDVYNRESYIGTSLNKDEFILPYDGWPSTSGNEPSTIPCIGVAFSVSNLEIDSDPQGLEPAISVSEKPSTVKGPSRPKKSQKYDDDLEKVPSENNTDESSVADSKPSDRPKDQFDVYGEYIAEKLRKLDWKSFAYVQKAIGDIISEAEMGKYSQEPSVPVSATPAQ